MIEGLAGVVIWTQNLDNLVSFYRNTLRLSPHSTRTDFVSFKWGKIRLAIGKHSLIEGKSKEPLRIMINLNVDDIHQAYKMLKSRGVTFIRPPQLEQWGGWVCTFSDPENNTIQLLQQPA